MKTNKKIAILGAGHMGTSIRKGLLNRGFNKSSIRLSYKAGENKKIAGKSDWILIAVKPKIVTEVLQEIKDVCQNKLIISIAAGVTIARIQSDLSNNQKIVRLMPNIPVSTNNGVICMYANEQVSQKDRREIKKVFSGLGTVVEVKTEEAIDLITIVSSCGVGIVAYLLALFEKYTIDRGLDPLNAQRFIEETFRGTLNHLQLTKLPFKKLQDEVSTKGGITEHIISILERGRLEKVFREAFEGGFARLQNL